MKYFVLILIKESFKTVVITELPISIAAANKIDPND